MKIWIYYAAIWLTISFFSWIGIKGAERIGEIPAALAVGFVITFHVINGLKKTIKDTIDKARSQPH